MDNLTGFSVASHVFDQFARHMVDALAKGADPPTCWTTGIRAFVDQWNDAQFSQKQVAAIVMAGALRKAMDLAARPIDVVAFGRLTVAEIDQQHASASTGVDLFVSRVRASRGTLDDAGLWHSLVHAGAETHPGGLTRHSLANLQLLVEAVVRLAKLP